jgi:hypothetical protein
MFEQVHPFASLVERVPRTCPRLLINREAVGEATGWGDRGFSFREGSRDRFFQGDADAGARELARGLGWQVSSDEESACGLNRTDTRLGDMAG